MSGIVGYGVYVPKYRIKVEEIAKVWGEEPHRIKGGLGINEKAVPDVDEDTATFSSEAARNAIKYAKIDPKHIGAIFIGSESHPYAVKPTATIVAEAIGASPYTNACDFEFACKAGTTAIQCCLGLTTSNMIKYGLAIGADTSQSRPNDALEYSAGAGGAAFIIGQKDVIAEIEGMCSYTTDTPDFWRRPMAEFPSHGGRFTGEPAYFKHVVNNSKALMEKLNLKTKDFDYVVFHQPNAKFPLQAAKMLGFEPEKLKQGLLTPYIGNTYSGATLLGLASVLDVAKPGDRILAVSFGSGAGSDAMSILVTKNILTKRGNAPTVQDYVNDKEYLDYGLYVKHKRKLKSL
ncbi:hydroxymethylglutaryl-CoA synthase [Candidatus Micrarchaeota archaeon]|nr:hydroxymethylglutaryl-CoA synthase [Candidatus Micrarchaeota archaeon]